MNVFVQKEVHSFGSIVCFISLSFPVFSMYILDFANFKLTNQIA